MTTNCSNVYLSQVEDTVLIDRIKKIENMDLRHIVVGQAVNSIDVRYKGEHLIIRAMGELKKRGVYIEFQVVGPGTGKYLRQVAKECGVIEQLKLIGTLKQNEMLEWYKGIDIYAQPSKQEGLPRSVIEAMSVGCPVIGSRIAGIPELLDSDCMFNPNRIGEIVCALEGHLDKKTMKDKATINFQRAKKYNIHDIENRRQQMFSQFLSMIKTGGK